jgi:hypothetical protein
VKPLVSIQEQVMMVCIRQLIWAKLGDEYVMESGMCGYNEEISKRDLFVTKRNLFDF